MNARGAADEPSTPSAPGSGPEPPRVVVYTRQGCHLCADALDVVERVCAQVGVAWTSVDVDGSADLRDQLGEYVPVVVVDGVQQGFWRIDEERLKRVLGR